MTLCPDCGAGCGHYDQDCPTGPLYHKTGMVEESVLDTADDPEESQEEFSELTLPTFAALEDENEIVPVEESEDDSEESDSEDSSEEVEEEIKA